MESLFYCKIFLFITSKPLSLFFLVLAMSITSGKDSGNLDYSGSTEKEEKWAKLWTW